MNDNGGKTRTIVLYNTKVVMIINNNKDNNNKKQYNLSIL